MKHNIFNSLGAKLFYVLSFLVVITVCAIIFQSYTSFSDFARAQDRVETTRLAERTASDIETLFDGWIVALSRVLSTSDQSRTESSNLRRFINQHSEFLAIQLFSANDSSKLVTKNEVFSSKGFDDRLENMNSVKLVETIRTTTQRWLEYRLDSASKQRYFVRNLSRTLKLPVGRLAVKFDIATSNRAVWVVFTYWQDSITKNLLDSENLNTLVIDRHMDIFASTKFSEMTSIEAAHSLKLKANPLVKRARFGKRLSGYYSKLSGEKFKQHSGAYAKVPRFDGLIVVVEKNLKPIWFTVASSVKKFVLWTILLLLLAAMMSALIIAPIRKRIYFAAKILERIGKGDFSRGLREDSGDEIGLLGQSINQMTFNMQNLLNDKVEKGRFGKEEETSELIQTVLFPKGNIKSGSLSISGHHESAPGCKGDIWGHLQISDGVEFIYIADAAGQGMPAVILTTMIYATFTSASNAIYSENIEGNPSPARILEKLNETIYNSFNGSISMSFFASVIDSNRGIMTFANAGHPFPFLLPHEDHGQNEEAKSVKKNSDSHVIPLILKGAPLGVEKTMQFKEKMVPLYAGDKIFYFTDGLIEGRSPEGRAFGRKQLLETIVKLSGKSAGEMKGAVMSHAIDFYGKEIDHDDMTVVVAEVDKKWMPKDADGPKAIDEVLEKLQKESEGEKVS